MATSGNNLTIRLRTREDDPALIALWDLLGPEFPRQDVEQFRHYVEHYPPDLFAERWVAESGEGVVAFGALVEERTSDPGAFYVDISVHPKWQRRGAGSRLYEHLLQRAQAAGARRLYVGILDDRAAALEFAAHRGFTPTGKGEQLSRLEVSRVQLEGLEGVEDRLLAEGITIDTLATRGPDNEQFMQALYELDAATHADIPSSEEHQFAPYDTWLTLYVFGYGRSADWCWVAMDGDRPVALARLSRQGPDAAWNSYTGVDRAYRGRGIARALKFRTIEWCRRNGIMFLYTGNEAANERMLTINRRMGYQMLPREIELVKHLA